MIYVGSFERLVLRCKTRGYRVDINAVFRLLRKSALIRVHTLIKRPYRADPGVYIYAFVKLSGKGGGQIFEHRAVSLYIAFRELFGAEEGLLAVITGLSAAVIVTLIVRRIRKESTKEPFALVPFLGFGAMLSLII